MATAKPARKRQFGPFGALMLFLLVLATVTPLCRGDWSPWLDEAWFRFTVRPGVTRENFARIRKWMEQEYVDKLMGCKPSIWIPPLSGCTYFAYYEGPEGMIRVRYFCVSCLVDEMDFSPRKE